MVGQPSQTSGNLGTGDVTAALDKAQQTAFETTIIQAKHDEQMSIINTIRSGTKDALVR